MGYCPYCALFTVSVRPITSQWLNIDKVRCKISSSSYILAKAAGADGLFTTARRLVSAAG